MAIFFVYNAVEGEIIIFNTNPYNKNIFYKSYINNDFLYKNKILINYLDKEYNWDDTKEEKKAIFFYTNDRKSYINNYFCSLDKKWETKFINEIKIDYTAFKKICFYLDIITQNNVLKKNTIIYRGLKDINFIKEFRVGEMFVEPVYSSTSFDRRVTKVHSKEEWVLSINTLKNTKGAYFRQYSSFPSEIEFTLPRN